MGTRFLTAILISFWVPQGYFSGCCTRQKLVSWNSSSYRGSQGWLLALLGYTSPFRLPTTYLAYSRACPYLLLLI
ncbi:hypothetical protein F4803DRAFT_521467 [Xylaria telfairii]|nr:hypothetical protein F4803DRAFT_521467 [Xylaria telfairii]